MKGNEIFTIAGYNVTQEEGYENMMYAKIYKSENSAVRDARRMAKSTIAFKDLIIVSVYAGEYQNSKGDIYGEPFSIYSISNKPEEQTSSELRAAGYCNDKVDEYAVKTKNKIA